VAGGVEGVAFVGEVDGLAFEVAPDAEFAEPVTSGGDGVLPTQGALYGVSSAVIF